MKTKAVRLYGANDLRLEEFELPEINEREILMRVVTDSLCTSTYKAVKLGAAHKRVPNDVATTPIIVGHEMCGEIVKVGAALAEKCRKTTDFSQAKSILLPGPSDIFFLLSMLRATRGTRTPDGLLQICPAFPTNSVLS